MALAGYLEPWSGIAWRHIPADLPYSVLDFRFAGRAAENRWNEQGTPTLYLAGDEGVLITEWGRHFQTHRTAQLQQMTVERRTFTLELSIDHVLDLRSEEVCHTLSLDDAPYCFADIAVARATANFVRSTTDAQALLVPSMGFLDDLTRWCLVAFLEKLPSNPRSFIAEAIPRGPLRLGDPLA